MKIRGDSVMFETTGREARANRGIIGISGGMVFDGYDGEFVDEDELTPGERNELADFMVAQWEAFRTGSLS